MTRPKLLACLVILALPAAEAAAHARWTLTGKLKPRNDNSGLKTEPCGNVPKTTDPAKRVKLVAGEEITVEWEETIDHPGWYRIAFSQDGESGFDDNVLKDEIEDQQGGGVSIGDPSTYHKYSTKITVPDVACDACSFQLIQVMTDDPANPRNYYSCADVVITKGSGSTGTATGGDDDAAGDKPPKPTGLEVEVKRKKAAAGGKGK